MSNEQLTDLQEKVSDYYMMLVNYPMDGDALHRIVLFNIDSQEQLEENARFFTAFEFEAIELALNPK